jgi:hypothetical protein
MKTIRQTATIRGATPQTRDADGVKVGHDLEVKQLTLTKDKRIVQTWRANNWPKGTGVPDKFYGEISNGGREYGRHCASAR